MSINHLEDAYKSPNSHDLRDYLDSTSTKEIRDNLTDMLHNYADIGFLVQVQQKLSDFIDGRDKYEHVSDLATD